MRRKAEPTERHPLPPSRRGGKGGPRELSITTLFRASPRVRSGEAAVPYLRISGRWLEQYGLMRGSRVVVSGEPGKLVLTVANDALLEQGSEIYAPPSGAAPRVAAGARARSDAVE